MSDKVEIHSPDGLNKGYTFGWLAFKKLNIEGVLLEWQNQVSNNNAEFIKNLDLEGILSEQSYLDILAGNKILGKNLGNYLSAIIPNNICSYLRFQNAVNRELQKENKPEILDITSEQLNNIRASRVNKIKAENDNNNSTNNEKSEFLESLEAIVMEVAKKHSKEEIDFNSIIKNLASAIEISEEQLLGKKPLNKGDKSTDIAERLAAVLDLQVEDYNNFVNSAEQHWQGNQESKKLPALSRIVKFLRVSEGLHQAYFFNEPENIKDFYKKRCEIGNIERFEIPLNNSFIADFYKKYSNILENIDEFINDYKNAYGSFVKNSSQEIFSNWQKEVSYNNTEFIKSLGLEGIISAQDYLEVLSGEKAFGDKIINYLAAIVPNHIFSSLSFSTVFKRNLKGMSEDQILDLTDEQFDSIRAARIEIIASEEANIDILNLELNYQQQEQKNLPALSKIVKFLRVSEGLTQDKFTDSLNNAVVKKESAITVSQIKRIEIFTRPLTDNFIKSIYKKYEQLVDILTPHINDYMKLYKILGNSSNENRFYNSDKRKPNSAQAEIEKRVAIIYNENYVG